jgi:adenylate cyclase
LGVRYVLEGSVRRAGNRVRITKQLINSATGDHLWAEQYDRDLEDVFAVQDEITQVVAGAIEPEITKAEFERQRHAPPESLDAWQLYQCGVYHFHQPGQIGASEKSIAFLQAAIEKDPSFSPAYSMLARAYSRGTGRRLEMNPDEGIKLAIAAAQHAVSLDPEDAHAQAAMDFAFLHHDSSLAEKAFNIALTLNPNFAAAYFGLGLALVNANRAAAAVAPLKTAVQISPRHPLVVLYQGMLASAHFALGNDDTALALLGGIKTVEPASGRRSAVRIAVLAHLGHEEEVREELGRYLKAFPHATISLIVRYISDLGGRLTTGLRKAGMPE